MMYPANVGRRTAARSLALVLLITTLITILTTIPWATANAQPMRLPADITTDAARLTPRDLRPQPTTPPSDMNLLPSDTQRASSTPSGSRGDSTESLHVTVGHIEIVDGFAEMEASSTMLTDPFIGRQSTTDELNALAEALETLYYQAGYVFARVTIPPQQVNNNGVFQLRVIDGYIDAINMQGVPTRLHRSLNRTLQKLVNRRQVTMADVERALMLAGQTPGLQIRSTLVPGDAPGATTLVLEGQHQMFSGSWSSDNRLSEAAGTWQSNVQLQVNQALGFGEQFYVYFSGDPDPEQLFYQDKTRRIGGAGVSWSIGSNGLSLNLEMTRSDTFTESTNFFIPNTRSQFQRDSVRLSYPLTLTRQRQVTLTGIVESTTQLNEAPDFGLQLFRDELTVARANVSLTQPIGTQHSLNVFMQGSLGLSAGSRSLDDVLNSGVPYSRAGAKSDFRKLEVTANLTSWLPRQLIMTNTLRGQYAFGSPLPSSELFSLDGETALSAMVSGLLADDGGWTLRSELSRNFAVWSSRINLTPFVYASAGIPYSELESDVDHAAAAGAGVRLQGGPIRATVEYGHGRWTPNGINSNELFARLQVVF